MYKTRNELEPETAVSKNYEFYLQCIKQITCQKMAKTMSAQMSSKTMQKELGWGRLGSKHNNPNQNLH